MYLMMIGIMMPRIIRTRDRISKSLIHIALLYESVKRGLFKKEVTLTFMRAEPSTVMAAPKPHIAVRFYSTRNHLIWQCFYSTLTATSLQFSAAAIRSSARSCTMCFFCSMSATSVHETPAAEANSRCDILSACRCKIRLSISSI